MSDVDVMPMALLWWHWLVLGLVLLVAEVLTLTTFALWMAAAAFATGVIVLVAPALGLAVQVALWGSLSLVATGVWFRFRRRGGNVPDSGLNQRGRSYVGRELTLSAPIHNGVGQARLGDSVWRVAGPDLPAGARVRVLHADGTTLQVEALAEQADQR